MFFSFLSALSSLAIWHLYALTCLRSFLTSSLVVSLSSSYCFALSSFSFRFLALCS